MDRLTVNLLIELNRQFYQTFAPQFSATRQRLQPGVRRILEGVHGNASILDVGCGNGELWRALQRSGFQGTYVGLDFSAELLQIARQGIAEKADSQPLFIQADLTESQWDQLLPERQFDIILAFAVLHHLPGESLRQQVFGNIHRLLGPGGRFHHSNWQFLNSERLRKRVQPWERANISPAQVDPGDYLLDWKEGGYGLRYVHHFEQAELAALATANGFHVTDVFLSDGKSANLGLYMTWEISKISL